MTANGNEFVLHLVIKNSHDRTKYPAVYCKHGEDEGWQKLPVKNEKHIKRFKSSATAEKFVEREEFSHPEMISINKWDEVKTLSPVKY